MPTIEEYRAALSHREFVQEDGDIRYRDDDGTFDYRVEDREDFYPHIPAADAEILTKLHRGTYSVLDSYFAKLERIALFKQEIALLEEAITLLELPVLYRVDTYGYHGTERGTQVYLDIEEAREWFLSRGFVRSMFSFGEAYGTINSKLPYLAGRIIEIEPSDDNYEYYLRKVI